MGCGNTFVPVCRGRIIRTAFAVAAENILEVLQLDVQTAFLNADVEELCFVKFSPCCESKTKDGVPLVMKPRKSIYGLL